MASQAEEKNCPDASQAIANTERDVHLGAEAVIRYRNHVIRVVHHVIGEKDCCLTFTVSIGLAPRSYDKLSDACEYIDGLLTVAT